MPDGGVLSPSVAAGTRLIDALAAVGIPTRRENADIEPASACRARFPARWAVLLQAPDDEERAILGATGNQDGTNRLLRKVTLTPDLDGLELELPWDALIPQTYWVAG